MVVKILKLHIQSILNDDILLFYNKRKVRETQYNSYDVTI